MDRLSLSRLHPMNPWWARKGLPRQLCRSLRINRWRGYSMDRLSLTRLQSRHCRLSLSRLHSNTSEIWKLLESKRGTLRNKSICNRFLSLQRNASLKKKQESFMSHTYPNKWNMNDMINTFVVDRNGINAIQPHKYVATKSGLLILQNYMHYIAMRQNMVHDHGYLHKCSKCRLSWRSWRSKHTMRLVRFIWNF